MKIRYTLLVLAALLCTARFAQAQKNYKWWNPAKNSFPVIQGQGWHEGLAHPYDRLPARAEKNVRKIVWNLSRESSGLMIRFRTNATDIVVRYTVGSSMLSLPHMPATGVSGLDLYAVDENGAWQWCGGKWSFGDTIQYHYFLKPSKYEMEYHLYLPLYNSVKWLEIGVPQKAHMQPLPVSPDKPIVIYGTSIAQGACASRPGMTWASLLGRHLHTPVIDLGFSGNGRLEKPVVSLLTELDPKIYVIDCLPNMTGFADSVTATRLAATVETLRKKKPDVPVLITEDADASIRLLNRNRGSGFHKVNRVADSVFAALKAKGIQDIYLLTAKNIGLGIESTVGGIHPSDYGMEQYAAAYEQIIRAILHEPKGAYTTTQPCRQYRDRSYDWNARHRKELELIATKPPRIVFLGNSITHFWGGQPEGPYRRGEDSWSKDFGPLGAQNFGYGWDRVENVLWRVYHGELDGYKASQIVMMIGTNNIGYNSDSEILAGLKLLISQIKLRQPDARFLLLGIFPRRGQEQRIAGLNKQIVQLAGMENVEYADPGKGLLDSSGKKINDALFVQDGVHPDAAGYRILAKAIKPYLRSSSSR
jgi:lysophospholipase L1-like esterase